MKEKGERIVSFLAAKLKEEEKEKKGRKSEQRPRTTQVWGKSGSLLFFLLLMAQNWLCVAAAEVLQKRTEMMGKVAESGSASEREQMGGGDYSQKEKTELK